MRRRTDQTEMPYALPAGTAGPAPAQASPVAGPMAHTNGAAPASAPRGGGARVVPTIAIQQARASTDPFPIASDPFPTATDPFPTATDPFPVATDPFPTATDPFPVALNPFPVATNPFSQPTNPLGPVTNPLAPQPVTVGPSTNVTPAEIAVISEAIGGPAARAGGLTGAGIRIGIISDSLNVNNDEQAAINAGLLAGGVTVLKEGPAGSTDEGLAMAELVHGTAPGASLYFYSGAYSEADMAAGVTALEAAGCNIIVDDIGYFDEPMFQDAGPLDTAISAAVANGVSYFTATGNDGNAAYQAAANPHSANIAGLGTVAAQLFDGAATTPIIVLGGAEYEQITLDWSANYNGDNPNAITMYLLANGQVIAESVQDGTAPVTTLTVPISASDATYDLAVVYNNGTAPAGTIKVILQGGAAFFEALSPDTGSVYGHPMLPGVNAVGAIDVTDTPAEGGTPAPEYFSSTGGSEFLLSASGSALSTPEASGAPEFLAPDGGPTSVFDPFFGTSAAAPVAAAVGALMMQANSHLTNTDITTLLEDSALPVASSDDAAGAGMIQANLATQFASTDVISGSEQTVIRGIDEACTIQGGSGGHWLMAGTGNTLIQSQGVDSVQAGSGADTVDLTGASAAVYGSTGPLWVRTLGGNDTVAGGAGAMTVSGGAGGGIIFGGSGGDDALTAGDQQTIILSDAANDTLTGVGDGDLLFASGAGQDTLTGGAGTEILVGGGGGTDLFQAGNGTPLIAPEGATAVVALGTGEATALLGSASAVLQLTDGQVGGMDWIYDFDPSKDMLQLSGYAQAAGEEAVADQYDAGGTSWLKLPDGTVVAFLGLGHLSASNVTFG